MSIKFKLVALTGKNDPLGFSICRSTPVIQFKNHSFHSRCPLEDVCLIDKYSWLEMEGALGEELLGRLGRNLTVPLVVIR